MTRQGRGTRWAIRTVVVLTTLAVGCGGLAKAGSTAKPDVNVRDFGAVGDGLTDDTAAIQRANDAAASQGGGRVVFPDGVYVAGGVQQDSGVEFSGGRGAVLKHPNGINPRSIVSSRRWTTTGSIVLGSRTLRVASTSRFRPGSPVAISGAGGFRPARFLYARVASVGVGQVGLDVPAAAGVSNATVFIGSLGVSIRGMTLDGNRPVGGSLGENQIPVRYELARWASVTDTYIRNGEHGAVSFDLGTSDSVVENNVLMDNGNRVATLGATIWLFRGASRNTVRNNTIGGDAFRGIFVDDQTQTSTEWDASSNDNVIEGNSIDIAAVDWNSGIHVVGGSGNVIRRNAVRNVALGIAVDTSMQGARRTAQHNVVSGNSLSGHATGVQVSGSYNSFAGNLFAATSRAYVNTGVSNTIS